MLQAFLLSLEAVVVTCLHRKIVSSSERRRTGLFEKTALPLLFYLLQELLSKIRIYLAIGSKAGHLPN